MLILPCFIVLTWNPVNLREYKMAEESGGSGAEMWSSDDYTIWTLCKITQYLWLNEKELCLGTSCWQ